MQATRHIVEEVLLGGISLRDQNLMFRFESISDSEFQSVALKATFPRSLRVVKHGKGQAPDKVKWKVESVIHESELYRLRTASFSLVNARQCIAMYSAVQGLLSHSTSSHATFFGYALEICMEICQRPVGPPINDSSLRSIDTMIIIRLMRRTCLHPIIYSHLILIYLKVFKNRPVFSAGRATRLALR